MAAPAKRQDPIAAALARIAPRLPEPDRAAVVAQALGSKGLRTASPEAAAWLSLVAYVRHNFTDYDELLAEGYGLEAARHFCLEQLNGVLAEWGCKKQVGGED